MKDLTQENITELVSSILETMAFVFVEPSGQKVDVSELRHSKISYFGAEESAHLFLSASDGFLVELASSMLGAEPDEIDASVEGRQALNELANIVCGEVIHSIGGEERVFSQGLPEEVEALEPTADGDQSIQGVVESEEGEFLHVLLTRAEL